MDVMGIITSLTCLGFVSAYAPCKHLAGKQTRDQEIECVTGLGFVSAYALCEHLAENQTRDNRIMNNQKGERERVSVVGRG